MRDMTLQALNNVMGRAGAAANGSGQLGRQNGGSENPEVIPEALTQVSTARIYEHPQRLRPDTREPERGCCAFKSHR